MDLQFCVSSVLQVVCDVGMRRMIDAWNSHPIPLRGVPNQLQEVAFHTALIHPAEVPGTEAAIDTYRRQGGRIREPGPFGEDPLEGDPILVQQRQEMWTRRCGISVETTFSELVSSNPQPPQNAILKYIEITNQLSPE